MSFSIKPIAIAILFAVTCPFLLLAQTPEQVSKITSHYNINYLNQLSADFLERSQSEKASAVAYAKAYNLPITKTLENGSFAELQRVLPDGTLIYYQTNNVNAAKSTRVNHINIGGTTGFNLDGQNMIAYVWDGGHPRVTHQEYDGPGGNNRVTIQDVAAEGGTQLNFHAAHVTGTIAASGFLPAAKGMAPQAKVRGYMWNNDESEATTAAANGMLLSNHSYGFNAVDILDQWFGAYQTDARNWDVIMYNAPFYLMVNSAGNDGTDNTSNAFPLLGNPNYDKLNGISTAKNNLVIAAANDANIDANGNLVSVSIASFSSQGPTDDFRIKPDITGNGVGLTSSYDSSNSAYGTISGTSMSSPNVTGSLLLLQQHANQVNGNFMRAATLKGLALHTADDAGPTGPDAVWGWGLLNAKRAAEAITNNGTSTLMQELTLFPGQTYTINVDADGINDLLASISWTDPAGTINTGTNSSTPALVNDLDIRVTQGATTFYPWRLTGLTTNSNGGDNNVDPFERVDIAGASGSYTITVTHKGSLTGGSQNFSLLVSGLLVVCSAATVPQNIMVNGITGTTAGVSWQTVAGASYDIQYREIGAPSWILVENLTNPNYLMTGLSPTTNYELQVRSKCPAGSPSVFSASVNFTTIGLTYCNSSSQNPSIDLYISNVSLNTINNISSFSAYTDYTGISTTLEQGQTYQITITVGNTNPSFFARHSVWIDYNVNESFNDPGEQVFTLDSTAGIVATGQFTVPMGINEVTTRMRVSMSNTGIPTSCENFPFGEVEDYTVVVKRPEFIYENGSWTPQNPVGVITSNHDLTVINGTAILNGNINVYDIAINPGANLSTGYVVKLFGDVNNQGAFVFSSDATRTGQLDAVASTSVLTGPVTIQRYIPARRAFRFLSSSVTTSGSIHANWQEGAINAADNPNPGFGTHITGSTTGANGFDATPSGNPSMFTLNNTAQAWQAIANTDVNTLTAGTPYRILVRGDRSINVNSNSSAPTNTTLQATGTLFTGTKTDTNFSTVAGEFNFFGNPYPAAVDMNAVVGASTNINPNFYYVWDPTLGGVPDPGTPGGRGAYVTVALPAGTNASSSAANQYLQPGQAAFVTTLANGAASITFQETQKAVNQPLTAVFITDAQLDIRLYEATAFATGNTASDGLRLQFAETGDNAITALDAAKFFNQDENLAIQNDGKKLSIESRALPQVGEVLPLFTNQYRHTEYVLEMHLEELQGVTAYLRDVFTGENTELTNNDTTLYSFTIDQNDANSIAPDRFEVVFEEVVLGTNDQGFGAGFVLYPNPSAIQFAIGTKNLNGQEVTVQISNVLGQEVFQKTYEVGGNGQVSIAPPALSKGIYVVTLTNEEGARFTTKWIKK